MKKTLFYATNEIPANMVIITNDNLKPGQHTIIHLPGVGQRKRGNFANWQAALASLANNAYVAPIYKDVDAKEFNVIILCPEYDYTLAEIRGAFLYSRDVLKSKYESVLNHSLGGFAFSKQVTAEIAEMTDGCCWIAPGYGYSKDSLNLLSKAGFANWFITSNLDTQTAGDLGWVSENWDKLIGDAGGVSFLTLYDDTSITNEHSIFMAVMQNPAMWKAHGDTPVPMMTPTDWLLSNAYGLPVVPPDGKFSPVVPKNLPPVVDVPPVIEPGPPSNQVRRLVVSPDPSRNSQAYTLIYSDVDQNIVRAPEGERNRGVSVWLRKGLTNADVRLTADYQDKGGNSTAVPIWEDGIKYVVISPDPSRNSQAVQLFFWDSRPAKLIQAPVELRNRGVDIFFKEGLTDKDIRISADYQKAGNIPIPFIKK